MDMTTKHVYFFEEGRKDMKNLLGGKGANLAEMTNIGLPVPAGFTITTDCCKLYYKNDRTIPEDIIEQIINSMKMLEQKTSKGFGDAANPLLVSVRSGSVFSMPGMMDTILNLGLNDETVEGLKKSTDNGRFAYDSYRRFIQMFGDVVLEIEKYKFDMIFNRIKAKYQVSLDYQLTEDALREIIQEYKRIIVKELVKKGNVTKIRVKKDDKTLIDLPINAGALGVLLIPKLTALGAAIALLSRCTIEIEGLHKKTINVDDGILKDEEEIK